MITGAAPAPRSQAHHREVVSRDEADVDLRSGLVLDEIQRDRRILGDLAERLRGRPEVVDLGNRERDVVAPLRLGRLAEVHEPVAVAMRQRAEEHTAHGAEDRGVGTDAEAQGEDDGEGEAGGARKAPEDIAEVERHRRFRRSALEGLVW